MPHKESRGVTHVCVVDKRRGEPNLPPLSDTSGRLAMRPRCDPTVRTAPHPNAGRVASAWVFAAALRTSGGWAPEAGKGLDLQQTHIYRGGVERLVRTCGH